MRSEQLINNHRQLIDHTACGDKIVEGGSKPKKRVLFVCLGNICRSPSAQGIFDFLATIADTEIGFETDSAGTHDYHIGKAPDGRAISAMNESGIDISGLRGRQFEVKDFEEFDHILVMDSRNQAFLEALCPKQMKHKIESMISFLGHTELDHIPDPFHGEPEDFKDMSDLLFVVCRAALTKLTKRHSQHFDTDISAH